jgi:hypothetical protein
MTVTSATDSADGSGLDPLVAVSIELAVGQWLRSARATSAARERLRSAGVSEAEIEERRRCRSADPHLAALLRLAVTVIITRGRLDERDIRRVRPALEDRELRAIVAATAVAFLAVTLAESVDRTTPFVPIDVEIGDY